MKLRCITIIVINIVSLNTLFAAYGVLWCFIIHNKYMESANIAMP